MLEMNQGSVYFMNITLPLLEYTKLGEQIKKWNILIDNNTNNNIIKNNNNNNKMI